MSVLLYAVSTAMLAMWSDGQSSEPTRPAAVKTRVEQPGSELDERDRSEDGRWAFWARMKFHDRLGWSASSTLNLNEASRPDTAAPQRTKFLPERGWPFEGSAPRPPCAFEDELPDPVASVEWRRRGTTMVASFSQGDETLCRQCRQAMQALQDATDDETTPPDWMRDRNTPTTCPDSEGYLDESVLEPECDGEERESWASCWADAYPIGSTNMRLVIATDAQRETSLVCVFGMGEDGGGHAVSDRFYGVLGHPDYADGGPVVMYSDFDMNGTPDYFVARRATSLGIAITSFDGVFVLADAKGKTARITRFDETDIEFIDHDGNGRAEILTRTLAGAQNCIDGRSHNFWVTNLLGFQDLGVVDLREVDTIRSGKFVGRFPFVEWFAHDSRNRFRKLLTDEQRREMCAPRFPLYRKPAQPSGQAKR